MTDAQTQTDKTCIAELKSASSKEEGKQTPRPKPPVSKMAQIFTEALQSTSVHPNLLK